MMEASGSLQWRNIMVATYSGAKTQEQALQKQNFESAHNKYGSGSSRKHKTEKKNT